MKNNTMIRLAAATAIGLMLAQPALSQTVKDEDVVSYKLGHDIGQRIKALGVDVSDAPFMAGVRAALNDEPSVLTDAQDEAALTAISESQQQQAEAQRQQLAAVAEKNKTDGVEFLAKNKLRDEVTETESGLQYEVVEMGDGPKPESTDTVEVHYRGVLLDGTEFDSSYNRGEPISFALNGVIKGWTEGLQLMPVGSKFKFYIPSELAYAGMNRDPITPNSTLIFDVELLDIK